MAAIIGAYFFIQLAGVIVIIVAAWLIFDKRYKHNHSTDVPNGFEETNEVMLDPKDHIKYRVYFNPKTGERFYHKEE